jgi:hypothetical protein
MSGRRLPEPTGLISESGRTARSHSPTPTKDDLLDGAIKAGKFPARRRAHYAALYDSDPVRTTALIGRLAAGAVPADTPRTEGTGLLSELR